MKYTTAILLLAIILMSVNANRFKFRQLLEPTKAATDQGDLISGDMGPGGYPAGDLAPAHEEGDCDIPVEFCTAACYGFIPTHELMRNQFKQEMDSETLEAMDCEDINQLIDGVLNDVRAQCDSSCQEDSCMMFRDDEGEYDDEE